ncbi:chromosome segregation protein SMC [[Eubacterium] cellulosolvens]
MVYIKRIDLKGFKTFQHKVSLTLDRGLTVITGPNGSGKSNIVDAVKFALGELSPKEMRGASLEDVISKTSPTSFSKSAYVAIQFDNSDRRIPIDSDNVTVSRQFIKGGEGIYRVNGKRVSRKQVHDALSSSGISVSGLNIIPQHTITRLADVTSEERRRIIEEMIGIGVYDIKKAEAAIQLQHADINIRVASAKVDEVRTRVSDLERERNDLLRSNFLKEEINRLQAEKISYQIHNLEDEIGNLKNQSDNLQETLDKIRSEKESLTIKKTGLDREKREFEQAFLEKKNEQLFNFERQISLYLAETAKLTIEIKTLQGNHASLYTQIQKLRRNIEEARLKITQIEKETQTLGESKRQITEKIGEKENLRKALAKQIKPIRDQFASSVTEYEQLTTELHRLLEQKSKIAVTESTLNSKIKLLQESRRSLDERRIEYQKMVTYLQNKITEIIENIDLNKKDILTQERKTKHHQLLISERQQEVAYAQETVKKAKDAIAQACAQLEAHERITPGEKILRIIKDNRQHDGIHGRLRSLLQIPSDYIPAIEAAADGWLDALVVENLEDAISCIEILKKERIGRIKIIPLSTVLTTKIINNPENLPEECLRPHELVTCDAKFKPAVNFILGDTVITSNEKNAFLLSLNGVRAVAQNGDLFEPEGGIEGGYFRDSLDLWNLMTTSEISDLEKMVNNLEEIGNRNLKEIERLKGEINEFKISKTKKENLNLIKNQELQEVRTQLKKAKSTSQESQQKIQITAKEQSETEQLLLKSQKKKEEVDNKIISLRIQIQNLHSQTQGTEVKEVERKYESIIADLERLNRRLIEKEGNIQTLNSNHALLKHGLQEKHDHTTTLEVQMKHSALEIEKRKEILNEKKNILTGLNKEKSEIVSQITVAKDSRRALDQELKTVEEKLKTLYREYDEQAVTLNELSTRIKEREIERSFLHRDLTNLGFQTPLPVKIDEIDQVATYVEALRKELDDIGAVNELAPQQYDEYSSNYQQLSVRINTLEEEKLSILRFMQELDEKKKDAFMNAFRQVNQNFSEIFSVVIEGGMGRLALENDEDPFAAGIEILLRFPQKEEFSISGASGGERSVATVCFIIALQTIHPMPFYMFDEIDAHLDPLNSQRLADELKKRSIGSQFILISLKDTTISRADKVYGAYIDSGSSRLVSLPLQEAAP